MDWSRDQIMGMLYNINFEVAGVVFVLVIYAALCIFYSDQSEVNQKFKALVLYVLAAEVMDIVTAITISYGSVIPALINTFVNTVYFGLTFSLGYGLFQYVESYVGNNPLRSKTIRVTRMLYLFLLFILCANMLSGFIFYFDGDGRYIHGSLYLIVYLVPICYVLLSAAVLVKNQGFFNARQKISISIYMVTCIIGPVLQMLFFPNTLLSVFTPSVALLIILFSMETPDYRLLLKTLVELDDLRKNLEVEVKKRTKEAEERKEKVERLSEQIILTLAKTIDAKDTYTNGHSERVAAYAREIAGRLGMSGSRQQDIYYMGLLHDIGKIGISDAIINKAGKLNDEEYQTICRHPEIGEKILTTISEFPDISVGAKYHHEKYDGTGYPSGYEGEEIPFPAMIIGIADAYDAMTSKRSYRDVLPQQTVRAEIEKGRGTQFHPACADIMLQMMDEDKNYQLCEH